MKKTSNILFVLSGCLLMSGLLFRVWIFLEKSNPEIQDIFSLMGIYAGSVMVSLTAKMIRPVVYGKKS
jgi:chromate transport protein ChrA